MVKKKVGRALVVGAGISGIRSALDLAEAGYGVILVDRSPQLGGVLTQLDYQFPTDRCGMCKMLPLVDRDASSQYCLRKGLFHENIEILLSTEISAVAGDPGNFQVMLQQKPTWVDPNLCIGCGRCVPACPVDVPDVFNAGLGSRKAVYLPVPHAIPNPYVIDTVACTRCGACEAVCPTHAIRLSEQERKTFRILVVDDELIIRDSLKAWLADEEGFTVETAESGPEALDRLTRASFQLMLLDVKMPGMDGVEVLKKTKEIFPDLQVVMMTAYATVETAVEAMKTGALDYLVKPFDTDVLIPKIIEIYGRSGASRGRRIEVGSLILSGGAAYFDPADGKNMWGYGQIPGVVTNLEFERMLSGTGPTPGRLVRPEDGRPVRKIAWIQCIGSRDLQTGADFCSNVCCMIAVKEALVAKEKFGEALETTIFYMDMRTFGKSYQRYRDEAENSRGVCFVRGRVHSVVVDGTTGPSGKGIAVRYAGSDGTIRNERFDLVVLAVGQRPPAGTRELAEKLDLPLNEWGFLQTLPFSATKTERDGIYLSGAYSGLKDIRESVIQASAAALSASRTLHTTGGSLAIEPERTPDRPEIAREAPRILIVICTCGDLLVQVLDKEFVAGLQRDLSVNGVEWIQSACTGSGWESIEELVERQKPNRILIGACLPYLYSRKIRELGVKAGLSPSLMEVVDIRSVALQLPGKAKKSELLEVRAGIKSALLTGIAKLKQTCPSPVPTIPNRQRALVVGGGIAGMTAALAVADHGFEVDLVEREQRLGGNLIWLQKTIDGNPVRPFLDDTLARVEKHPRIHTRTGAQVVASCGAVGNFRTAVDSADGDVETIEHGVAILATGGSEAAPSSYSYGKSEAIITQKELAQKMADGLWDSAGLESVVMIQCVESREEPKNYCSRICCLSALKHALEMKEKNPQIDIYILYRDMMSYGFTETYFTRARKAGVIFIQYSVDKKPVVTASEPAGKDTKAVQVDAFEPVIGRDIRIAADLVVLSSGIVPNPQTELAALFGASVDPDGFFQEAEVKWRPVDALKEGVFACGLSLAPHSIIEAVTSAEAAAQRAIRILTQAYLPASRVTASVHHSLCSRCERCIEACPYGARTFDEDLEKILVNPVMCQGCGSCATVCPNGASVLEGFRKSQMLEVIDAALEGAFGASIFENRNHRF